MSRTRNSVLLFVFCAVIPLAMSPVRAAADGLIIPRPRAGETVPPLSVKYHHVTVEIRDQLARTSIDEVFVSDHDRDLEGTFIFPLPEGAAISEFAMFVGGERIPGEVLDSREARGVYEDIVRRLRDPALLEYIGRNMFRARVFPIPAHGEKRIQLSYTELLKSERGFVRYLYPLNTERFSLRPLEEVAISVGIDSRVPLANIYSPSHRVSVRKETPNRATVGFEERQVKPDKDFVVYYSVSADDVGLSLLTYRESGVGYFLLLAAPRYVASREKTLDKNLVFVLDSSGSMSGKKIGQARRAARFIIEHLDVRDRFSVIDFDDGVGLFARELVAADAENRAGALRFVDGVEDSGGTNINEALTGALALMPRGDRPNYVLFLTDGLPTVGVTGVSEILKNVREANTAAARLFIFGVGNDVNTELLDKLAAENRGTSVYVGENEDLEGALSGYYEKISAPVLADLKLTLGGIEPFQVYPGTLPDLFKGSQLVVLGKFKGSGPISTKLMGKVGNETRSFSLDGLPVVSSDAYRFLPRLWANRRVGYLLEELRLHGEEKELVDEVRDLGLKYGIVTPYTSFLVREKDRVVIGGVPGGAAGGFAAAREAIADHQTTGAGAVRAAKVSQQFKEVEQASEVISERVRYREDKTFYLRDGFWTDSFYVEGGPVAEVTFNSDRYFDLIGRKPKLARYLSLGPNVIVVFEGTSYRIAEKPAG
jgi:Ca-activated chloride channel family protein